MSHVHAAKLRPGCLTWPIVELLLARGSKGATTAECAAAMERAGHTIMNVGIGLQDIGKRSLQDLGYVKHSEPMGWVDGRPVWRYWLERVGLAPCAPEPAQPAAVAVPAPQASRSDDRSEAAALGLLFDDRPIDPL